MKRNSKRKKDRKARSKRGFKRHLGLKKRRASAKKRSFPKVPVSPLFELITSSVETNKRTRIDSKNYEFVVPSKFSLLENPIETIDSLSEFMSAITNKRIERLTLNHEKCDLIDIGASTVMDVLVLELRKELSRRGKRLRLSGKYSKKENVNELLRVTGIIKHIGHNHSRVSNEVKQKYKVFDLVNGREKTNNEALKSSDKERVTTDLIEYLNKVLIDRRVKLNRAGERYCAQMLSEVLANAEEHSGNKGWYIFAYLNGDGYLNITILNFGASMGESLKESEMKKSTKENIEALIKSHSKKGFFLQGEKWKPENLYTLFALQEGVSSKNITEDDDRGYGTIHLIEFFTMLSSKKVKPKMLLLSGNTGIFFDGSYRLKNKDIEGTQRAVIAFNKENDLDIKPDSEYVYNVKRGFPGTIISLKFLLDYNYTSPS